LAFDARRKTRGKPGENHGKTVEIKGKPWEIWKNPWENCGNQGKQNIDSWGEAADFFDREHLGGKTLEP
jgi:hypothetical protein